MTDSLFDGGGDDERVAELEKLLSQFRHEKPLGPLAPRLRRRRWIPTALVGAVAAAAGLWFFIDGSSEPRFETSPEPVVAGLSCAADQQGFAFVVERGAASCQGSYLERGVLPLSGVLQSSGTGVTSVQLGEVGSFVIHGDAEIQLREAPFDAPTSPYRFELKRGRIDVSVTAAPRRFIVDTPAVSAVDLGCEYELEVDERGVTRLRVTSGAVALEGAQVASRVPEGYEAVAFPGKAPGVPVALGASQELREAAVVFAEEPSLGFEALLTAAGQTDEHTLRALLERASGTQREQVIRRLEALTTQPVWAPDPTDGVWNQDSPPAIP